MNIQEIQQEISNLRKKLHQMPEFSLQEKQTKEFLAEALRKEKNLEVVDCGLWFYAKTKGSEANEENGEGFLAFRGDFDAVAGADGKPGHYCGHDGHASILAGFARWVSRRIEEGEKLPSMLFLFQPAEETGEGALLCREVFERESIREIYGFHNIPGFPANRILIRPGTFACASTGLEILVRGTPSHAAYPENGRNPAEVIAKLILYKEELLNCMRAAYKCKQPVPVILATIIGVDLGSASYGVSASEGVLRLTLRAEKETDFQSLVHAFSERAVELSAEAGMECSISRIEPFPATENHPGCAEYLKKAADRAGLSWVIPEEPFRWSEDFGAYLQVKSGAMFGVGDGENWPQLHTSEYEFPDSITETVLRMYAALAGISAK